MSELKVSARSKVLSNWSSSLIYSGSPLLETSGRHHSSNRSVKHMRSNRLSDRRETPLAANKYTEIKTKENLKYHSNSTTTKDQIKDQIKPKTRTHSPHKTHSSISLRTSRLDDKQNDMKLRNGVKSGANSGDMSEESDPTPPVVKASKSVAKEPKKTEMRNEPKVPESGVESMDAMATDDNHRLCVREGCDRRINEFYLFEDKFCSSVCAVTQWTQDFRNTWGQQKS
ncbi:unnamed protein product [Oppiella nova]|uniref:Uncharacterized protein n=1 Tax=Oppiella nova TaxID=334625 RepID=A0A7R9LQH8_9ACAR|nr:unnamed protein product [Oppiella nova]CAG2165622.1 unnamed protein product [Oppiella nova]